MTAAFLLTPHHGLMPELPHDFGLMGMHGLGVVHLPNLMRSMSIAGKVVDMEPIDIDAFEAMVAEALATIPDSLRAVMENVAIIIDNESPPGSLYGLYEGVPLTNRGTYAGSSPDRITLFLATICRSANTAEDLTRRVRVTLLHEVGHHFGIGEARLRELGWS